MTLSVTQQLRVLEPIASANESDPRGRVIQATSRRLSDGLFSHNRAKKFMKLFSRFIAFCDRPFGERHIGMGWRWRVKLASADAIAEEMTKAILRDLAPRLV